MPLFDVNLSKVDVDVAVTAIVPWTHPMFDLPRRRRLWRGNPLLRTDPGARETGLARLVVDTGAEIVHPYDDVRVIAGQGTAGLELLADTPDLDAVIAPVGGGGLMSGVAIVAGALDPHMKIYGAEPAVADDAHRSLAAGVIIPSTYPDTVADGLRTSLGNLTFPILSRRLERIITAEEAEIIAAMRLIWQTMKLVVEPSGAVPLAALLAGAPELKGKRVGLILSGGNVDLDHLPWAPAI